MTGQWVSTGSIDYLQRMTLMPRLEVARTVAEAHSRRVLQVRTVGRGDLGILEPSRRLADQSWRPRTAELITGLYGFRIPVAFSILGAPDGVRVHLGVWSSKDAPPLEQDRRRDVLRAVLGGLYTSITLDEVPVKARSWPRGGIALGVPDPRGIDDAEAAPIDRVIASLAGVPWSVLVLAHPVPEPHIARMRQEMLNEFRAIASGAEAEGAPSPLAKQYADLLRAALTALGDGLATGAWRTGVYLLGDDESYPRLAAAWRSVFSGEGSLPEPVRVHEIAGSPALADAWALPDQPGEAGPGLYRRPFELQSLLTSTQLASCLHLPELETPGFTIEKVARFDTSPPARTGDGLPLGRILQRLQETANSYKITLWSLTRHVLVAGVTGSGKTNTILSLLSAAATADVPFLVIEPAKTEYRSLLAHPTLGTRMRIFTAGKATVSPLLLNPFEVPAGITVSEHLDLVGAAFAVAFGMWTPLPQILERCLHEIYTDRGWDLRTNTNRRLRPGDDPVIAYPTLTDLVTKASAVIPTLGYEDRVTGDLRAALITRINGLRTGGKGAMLDVARSLPDEELFAQPTVIELEALGADDDKAFIAALLLIRLAEYRRANGQQADLAHLLVIEEAHRLLSDVPPSRSEEAADPRAQAVETFSNLLSEIRAYGQGVVIADQVPSRLAPSVVKNTDLKVVHRIVAADDRATMAGATVMDEGQARMLATLTAGDAAVFSTGDDAPMLIRVPLVKDPTSAGLTDADVIQYMRAWRSSLTADQLYLARPFCNQTCTSAPGACDAARHVTADEYVQRTLARIALATIEDGGAIDRLWDDLVQVVTARRPQRLALESLLRAVAGHGADWYAERRGTQNEWLYADTVKLGDHFRAVLLDKIDGVDPGQTTQLRTAFSETSRRLHMREYAPYPVCNCVCDQNPPLCLYRAAVADVVASGRYHASWRAADVSDAASRKSRRDTWEVCQDAAYEIIEFPENSLPTELNHRITSAAKRVCMCFEQQMLADDARKSPRTARNILARVLAESGQITTGNAVGSGDYRDCGTGTPLAHNDKKTPNPASVGPEDQIQAGELT
jgi:hypothetical protein